MNEADVKGKIIAHLKEHLPAACALRHEDMFRSGVPDISVTYGGRTRWLEVKLIRPRETPSDIREHFSGVQLATCMWLDVQGRCDYLVGHFLDSRSKVTPELHLALIKPAQVRLYLEREQLTLPDLVLHSEASAPLAKVMDRLTARLRARHG